MSIVGVYPPSDTTFPIGAAMNKNLTIRMGNCNHRAYIPTLVKYVRASTIDPEAILTKVESLAEVIDAYRRFDQRQPGWLKVNAGALRFPRKFAFQ